ncbi:sigma-70 family RNA polymerase sigma factor [Candidatus Dojkabacteria bacterium]|nr:sigma-70 family RNA polymerase sigma factor [Candidatus Dojkabacteria bacterium]
MIKLSREEQEILAKKEELTNEDYKVIYEAYYDNIFYFVHSRIKKREDAEDITSLVFEKVLKKLKDFKWQGVTITTWIYRIARNAIIDSYRKNNDRTKDSSIEEIGNFIESEDRHIESILIDGEEEIKLYKALRTFNENDQYLIYYKFFEEMSNQDISKVTGMSETNVGTRLHRLRNKLKKIISE